MAPEAAARGTAESRPVHREGFLPAVQVVLSGAFLEWAQQAVPAVAAEFADRASFLTGGTVAADVQVAARELDSLLLRDKRTFSAKKRTSIFECLLLGAKQPCCATS